VLGERIERNLYALAGVADTGEFTRQCQLLLDQANFNLEILRFQIRLAKDLQCLKVESYGFAAKAIDEIGTLANAFAPPWPRFTSTRTGRSGSCTKLPTKTYRRAPTNLAFRRVNVASTTGSNRGRDGALRSHHVRV